MSFKLKTILLVLSVSLIPYAVIMILMGSTLKKEYTENTLQEMQTQLQLNVDRIEQYLKTLNRDMHFMSRMDVMNDIYSKDLDKRISYLLMEKKKDLEIEGDFYLFDKNYKIIASSNKNILSDSKKINKFIDVEIISGFDNTKIGNLILDFSLKNFTKFFSNTKSRNYYIIVDKQKTLFLEKKFSNALKVQMPLKNKTNIEIVLQEDKEVFQNILKEYEAWFYTTLFVGALLISLIALYFSNRLIKPIISLSKAANIITNKKDYSYQVDVNSNDEIGKLSHSFNTMITSMSNVLDELKAESENKIKLLQEQSKNEMLEELSSNLSKYLSPQLYASIFSGEQSATLSSKRKKLTVFFSDIVDFTDTTDTMESEDLSELLNDYLNDMTQVALKHGATVDKYIGDSIMLFFGDPESKGVKEDAISCVIMALEMQEHMNILHKRWINKGFTKPFKVRMGIHTGYCTVGNFGSENRMEYTIIGSTVNLASRIESSAIPGEIFISEETQILIRDSFETKEELKITPKGFKRDISLFSVKNENKKTNKIILNEKGLSIVYEPDLQDATTKKDLKKTLEEFITKLSV
ncbi:MAG: HAMP domain-containing protein [Thiovulaceae bacterium]|nr:HAMP domain-containing protein [Sulfurimonadaceae bacterium]